MTDFAFLLWKFREFAIKNATNHHHPIWHEVAEALDSVGMNGMDAPRRRVIMHECGKCWTMLSQHVQRVRRMTIMVMTNSLTAWAAKWGVPAIALNELFAIDNLDGVMGDPVSETYIAKQCRLTADVAGGFLWRNNSGATFDARRRMIRYGLGNDSKKLNRDYKSSDLIGIGHDGVFLAVECKTPGWSAPSNPREHAQANFLNHVRTLGGRAAFVTDAAQVARLVSG